MSKYKFSLVFVFAVFWVWAVISPIYRHDWLLENYLVFVFVPIIFIAGRYFKLSNASYTLITIFMVLHVIGSHYRSQRIACRIVWVFDAGAVGVVSGSETMQGVVGEGGGRRVQRTSDDASHESREIW